MPLNYRSPKLLFWVVLSLTILMLFFGFSFYVNDYIPHPQFENFEDYEASIKAIPADNVKWFNAFFITDFIWAPALLYLLYLLIKRFSGSRKLQEVTIKGTRIFIITACLAYATDVIENVMYLTKNPRLHSQLAVVVAFKKMFYAISFIIFIYHVFLRYVYPNRKTIFRFLKASIISLIFIILILFLITGVGQGPTLIVDLLEKPINLLGLFFLLTFFAVILSHYPVYLDIAKNDNSPYDLEMATKTPILGFGIVFSKRNGKEKTNYKLKFLRRTIGLFVHTTFLYVLLEVTAIYFELSSRFSSIAYVLFIILVLFYFKAEQHRHNMSSIIYGKREGSKEEAAKKIIRLVRYFPLLWIIGVLCSVVAAIVAYYFRWSMITIIATVITLVINMLAYLYFRLSRSDLKYVYWTSNLEASNPDLFKKGQDKKNLILKVSPSTTLQKGMFNKLFYAIGKRVAYLSDNRVYLKQLQYVGLISLAFVLAANIFPRYAMHLNAVNVIVLNIIVIYSVIIILIKHYIFYRRYKHIDPNETLKRGKNFWASRYRFYRDIFVFVLPIILLVVVGWGFYSTSKGNDLHEIQIAEDNSLRDIDTNTYVRDFIMHHKEHISDSIGAIPIYFVGSYGGGLKANLWNLVLYEELNTQTNGDFFDHAMCLSGVSGGTVGISNYTMLMKEVGAETKYANERKARIDKIGVSNILSSDLTLLMGGDFVREYLPMDSAFCGRDRSYFGMREHAIMCGMDPKDFGKYSFKTYWTSVYNATEKRYPVFIVNATSTQGKQGVVFSLNHHEDEDIFPGADNVLLNDENDITYFGAVSTTNRFPLLSPAARIGDKGHFLDGGYFENSGLLSAKGFFNHLIAEKKLVKDSLNQMAPNGKPLYYLKDTIGTLRVMPVFINVINSEEYYVNQKLKYWEVERNGENDVSEIASILETVASTEKTPRYVTALIESQDLEVRRIMMPHKITLERVQNVLKGDPDEPLNLLSKIKQHNEGLLATLAEGINEPKDSYYFYDLNTWGLVEPPLARVLSTPARQYQKRMVIGHNAVTKEIDTIVKELKKVNKR